MMRMLFVSIIAWISIAVSPTLGANSIDRRYSARQKDSLRAAISSLRAAGRQAAADTLCGVFANAGGLELEDLRTWMEIKAVLGKYSEMAQLLCSVSGSPRLPAQYHCLYLLQDAPPDSVRAALAAFRACALMAEGTDTAAIRDWLAGTYARFGMHADEIRVLVTLEQAHRPVSRQLLERALLFFNHRLFSPAITSAALAYARLSSVPEKRACATILYQSYAATGVKDSAIYWLEQAGLEQEATRPGAILLYQSTGMLAQADSLISSLPLSFIRDTLKIRQLLLSNRPEEAAQYAAACASKPWWKAMAADRGIWRIRTLLFCGNTAGAAACSESLAVEPQWHLAQEALRLRYFLRLTQPVPAAAAQWARIEYAIYRGKPEEVADSLLVISDMPVEKHIFTPLIRALIDKKMTASAYRILTHGATATLPEHRFYLAEILLQQGETLRGKSLLQELLAAYPNDVFSMKARLLLAKLDQD